jgi:hypothetical protein
MEKVIYKSSLPNSFIKLGASKALLDGNQVVYTKKKFWFFDHTFSLGWPLKWLAKILRGELKKVNASQVIYFDTSKGLFGTKVSFGYKAGGGDDSNLDLTLTANNIEVLKKFILDNGGNVGATLGGVTFKTNFPWLSPKRWLSYREVITIADNGIGHTRRSWFKTRQSFLPYESINMYCYNGLINKDILLLGDTTINLVEKLSNSNNEKIKKTLQDKGITSTKGRKYLPAILSFKRGLSPDVLITTEKGILFKSKKIIGGQSNTFLGYDEINEFKKHGWYKLFAPISIEGRRVDARKGEGGNVNIMIEGIAFYRWCTLLFFNGSLKSTLKSNCR